MAVTSQQIADLTGVSRGTVDRVLHNRGRVRPEVAERVRRVAHELGYRPNPIGQALVRTPRDFRLGVVLQSADTPTMQIVSAGVHRAADELHASGVELVLREVAGLDTELVLEAVEELVGLGIHGLAIAPSAESEIRHCIDDLYEQNIPVVTLNSDVPGSKRLCFIGMDNYRGGQTAAGLMCQLLPDGGKVFPLAGHLNNTAHNNRLNGFSDTLRQETAYHITLLPFQPCFDRDDYAYEITQHVLQAESDLAGIYVASNGQQGVCQAVREMGYKRRVKVVAFDLNEPNLHLLEDDSLSCVLDQEAFEQGYRAPHLLYDYLMHKKKPAQPLIYTDIAIRTKYNSDLRT